MSDSLIKACPVCGSEPDFFWKDLRSGKVPAIACHSCMEFEGDEKGMVPVSRSEHRLLMDAMVAIKVWERALGE